MGRDKPSTKKGYYGADVTGPVFKRIAQKIYTDAPQLDAVENIDADPAIQKKFETYYAKNQAHYSKVPDVSGMAGMDAVSLLENIGFRVRFRGNGRVKEQSIKAGSPVIEGQEIILTLS